jgi:hypothetical protein
MQPAPGAFASNNPRVVALAGVASFRAAEPNGLAVGVFGWGDVATGYADNERTDAAQLLGFVCPVWGGTHPVRLTRTRVYIRPGYQVTLARAGDFWAAFDGGARAGDQVYARTVDGAAVSGYAADAEPTPWYVVNDAPPGGLAIISTYSKVTQ